MSLGVAGDPFRVHPHAVRGAPRLYGFEVGAAIDTARVAGLWDPRPKASASSVAESRPDEGALGRTALS